MIKSGVNRLWLACIVLAVGIGSCQARGTMKFDKIEYTMSEFLGAPEKLVIDAGGDARFESHSNEAIPGTPEIGTYRMSLPVGELDSIDKLLSSPPFKSLPDHWGRLRPGEDAKRIRVISGSDTTEKLVGHRESIDPGMQRVIDALDQIILDLRSHPSQTLRISLAQVVVSPDGALSAVLSLSNTGVEPMNCRNPLTMIGDSDAELSFQAWPDKPQSELRPEDLILLKPTSIEDLRSPDSSLKAPAFLELVPGATASFRIRLPLGIRRAGRYLVRTLYMNPARQIGGHPVFPGELFSQAVQAIFP